MNQAGERKDEKDAHAQQHVDFKNPAGIAQKFYRIAAKGQDPLRPFSEFEHHAAIEVLRRQRNGG